MGLSNRLQIFGLKMVYYIALFFAGFFGGLGLLAKLAKGAAKTVIDTLRDLYKAGW